MAGMRARSNVDENRCDIEGRLTADPTFTPDKKKRGTQTAPFIEFTMAVNSNPYNRRTTAYLHAIAWGKTAEKINAMELTKGYGVNIIAGYQTRHIKTDENAAAVYGDFNVKKLRILSLPASHEVEEEESEDVSAD